MSLRNPATTDRAKASSAPRLRGLLAVIAAMAALIAGTMSADSALGAGIAGPKPTATTLGADVINLKWSAIPNADGYRVKYSTSSKMSSPSYWPSATTTVATTFTPVQKLSASKTYYFQVAAFTGDTQLSNWSSTASATTKYSYATPTGLATANVASTSVELSWVPVSGAPGYVVRFYTPQDGAKYVWTQIENFTLKGINDAGLRKNTKYWVSVAVQQPAIGSPGAADYTPLITMSRRSKEITVTTSNYDIAAPSNLQASEQTSTTVKVSWDAPPDLPAGHTYKVLYSTSSSMKSAGTATSSETSLTLTGLNNNTNYYVRVFVVDPTGAQKSDRSAYQIAKTRIPRGTITGRVTGAPSGDVVAMVYGTGGELVYQADVKNSTYTAPVRPGSYRVKLTYLGTSGYTSMWAATDKPDGVPVASQGTVVTVSTSKTSTAPDLALAKGGTLSGVVKYAGSTMSQVDVTVFTGQTSERETEGMIRTGSAGTFSIEGLSDGDHWVRFVRSGYKVVSAQITIANAQPVNLTINLTKS